MHSTNPIAATLLAALEITSGCTEPSAIAYCASFAGKYLGEPPESFTLRIDQRTYKNAFAAGIPGAGQRRGTEWALLLGFVAACPEKRLSIFSGLDPHLLEAADQLHDRGIISVELVDIEGLLVSLVTAGRQNTVETEIKAGHTHVTQLRRNGEDLQGIDPTIPGYSPTGSVFDDMSYQAEGWPSLIEDLYTDTRLQTAVRQGIAYNMAAALHGQKYIKAADKELENLVMGAIYARMNGDPIPVMSCAGSGNKGLTSMIPVVAWARERTMGEEAEIKAVLVAVLLTTLITSRFGEVSSVCGAQYAAGAGVIGGILYLKKKLSLFNDAYNSFVSAIGGGFCDGAKSSCSMRGNVAVASALTAIKHAEVGFLVSARDGFLGETFHQTLNNLVKYNPLIARFELETIKILQNK